MADEPYRSIPVFARGGVIAARALVDEYDAALVEAYRWRLHHRGYAWTRLEGRRWQSMHRLVMGLQPGDPQHVDHINRVPLDNRRANLRIATVAQNAQNQGSKSGSSSSYRGVTWHQGCGKWMAQAKIDGRSHYLGVFEDEHEAAAVAAAFRARHMPFSEEAA